MDPTPSELLVSKNDGLATITLNRPPANSYYLDYLRLISKTIKEIDQDTTIKVILINSTSEKFFCAGADIKIFSANSSDGNAKMVVAAREVASAMADSKKIVVAAIHGHCLGGGLELAMACDIRLGAEGNYLIGLPEVKLGLMPGNGGTPRLIDLIGASRAMEMLVTGESIDPQLAFQYGLLNQLYSKNEFSEKVDLYVKKLAGGPGLAMAAIKQYVQKQKGLNLQQSLNLETELVSSLYDTADAREGFKAFAEKRVPKFL